MSTSTLSKRILAGMAATAVVAVSGLLTPAQAAPGDAQKVTDSNVARQAEDTPPTVTVQPWTAPAGTLADAGIRLGADYPLPIVEHGFARRRALAAFAAISGPAAR